VRIALIKTGALGDVVRTTSLLPALRRKFAGSDITWITSSAGLPLATGHESVEAVTIDDMADASWRHARYDWLISLDDDRACCELATTLNAARLSGAYLAPSGERTYTDDLAPWFGMGILRPGSLGGLVAANDLKRANSRTYAELLYAGLGLPHPIATPSVVLPRAARENAAAWLAARGMFAKMTIGMNTAAAGRWRFKSWTVDATAALARRLADAGWMVLVLGGRAEADRNAAICARAADARVLAGPSDFDVLSFAALIAECAALVCSDSLAMHLAIATGVPRRSSRRCPASAVICRRATCRRTAWSRSRQTWSPRG
jgi:heptosyltransferase-2